MTSIKSSDDGVRRRTDSLVERVIYSAVSNEASYQHCEEGDADKNKVQDEWTVAEAVDRLGIGRFQLILLMITMLLTVCDALEIMLLAVLAPVLQCEWMLNDFQVALITTVVFVGYLLTSSIWGSLSDNYGRRTIIVSVSLWIAFYGILTAFSPTFNWVLMLRGCVGLGMGGAAQGVVICSEYVPQNWRVYFLVVGTSVAWTVGVMFEIGMAAIILPNVSSDSPVAGWRVLVLVSALPMVLACLSLRWLPESARFLVAAGREREAKVVLDEAARINRQPKLPGTLKADPQQSLGNVRELFRSGLTLTTLGCWALWFTAAFAYYGMVLMSGTIFDIQQRDCASDSKTGGDSDQLDLTCSCSPPSQDAYVSMLISTLGEFASVVLNVLTMDRIGRKKSMALYLALQSIAFFLLIPCGMPSEAITALVFIIRGLSSAFFNAVYVYVAEVYPTRVRALGLGSSSAAARIGALFTPFVAQVLVARNRVAAFTVYGIVSLLAAVLSMMMPIESVDRPLAS